MNGKARVNLYAFVPHPDWTGVVGSVVVVARDFQRAENLAIQEAERKGFPGKSFTILVEPMAPGESPEGCWIEVERYRDVDDDERAVLAQFGIFPGQAGSSTIRVA